MTQRRFRATGLQRQIQAWETDDPRELAAQLRVHQDDVDESLRRAAGAWRLQEQTAGAGRHAVQVGALLMVDGDALVTLPEITSAISGQLCGVARLSTGNDVKVFATVQLRPGEHVDTVPRGRIDGVQRNRTPLSLQAIGVRVFLATSNGWWSLGQRSEYYAVDGARFESGTDAGSVDVRVAREGRIVTLSAQVTADGGSGNSIASSSGWLPEWARPALNASAWCDIVTSSNDVFLVVVSTAGIVSFLKRRVSSGLSSVNWTAETQRFQVSYVAT